MYDWWGDVKMEKEGENREREPEEWERYERKAESIWTADFILNGLLIKWISF